MGAVDRLLLVSSSPRLPAGMLSWPAWEALRSGPVFALDPESPQARAVRRRRHRRSAPLAARRRRLPGAGPRRPDRGLARRPGRRPRLRRARSSDLSPGRRRPVEPIAGSWDPPGARLLDVVAVMDRLRSPGGCPWDAEQTHADARAVPARGVLRAAGGDRGRRPRAPARGARATCCCRSPSTPGWPRSGRSRTAGPSTRWPADLVAKLVRRHPHVFADRDGRRRGRGGGQLGPDQGGGEAARVGHRRGAAGRSRRSRWPRSCAGGRPRPVSTCPRRPGTTSATGCSRWWARRSPRTWIRRRRCGRPSAPTATAVRAAEAVR